MTATVFDKLTFNIIIIFPDPCQVGSTQTRLKRRFFMAEIKSAIEIAMERTQGLRLSSAEKEKLKEDEFQSRAHALVNRFLEVDLPFREVEKELAKYSAGQRNQLEKLMVRDFAEALSLDADNELVFQGVETLAGEKKGTIPKVRELTREYRERRGEAHRQTAEVLKTRWANLGISGSAVVPKVEESSEWGEAVKEFKPSYEARLQSLKAEIEK
jgi:hypothetical protein